MSKYVVRVNHDPEIAYMAADVNAEVGITDEIEAAYTWERKQDAEYIAAFMNKGRNAEAIAEGFGCEVVTIEDDPLPLPG